MLKFVANLKNLPEESLAQKIGHVFRVAALIGCYLRAKIQNRTTASHRHVTLNLSRNKFQCCKLKKKIVAKSRTQFFFVQHVAATCNTEICCVTS